MNLALMGLLGMLQVASPQDTSELDYLTNLRNSFIDVVMDEGEEVYVSLPSLINPPLQRHDSSSSLSFVPALCVVYYDRIQNTIMSASSCTDLNTDSTAFVVSTGYIENENGDLRETIIVDWGPNSLIDVCYENRVINNRQTTKNYPDPIICQPQYRGTLERLLIQKRRNMMDPSLKI